MAPRGAQLAGARRRAARPPAALEGLLTCVLLTHSIAQFATRSLAFPVNADLTNVKADMDAGVLRVHVPKREETTRQRQTIKVA